VPDLYVTRKIFQERLPAGLLLLDGMCLFAVECHAYRDALLAWRKLDLGFPVTDRIFNQLEGIPLV
jgi:hypothetical protein